MNDRKNKSLYTLTKKFVEMLKEQEIVDLNIVTSSLNCAKKRRIYDVSNVLEGVGLIKKTQKNLYQYTGKTYKDDSLDRNNMLQRLKDERKSLELEEKQLDQDISSIKMNNESLSSENSYKYLTKTDFIDALGAENSVIVVKDQKYIKIVLDAEGSKSVQIFGFVVKPVTVQLVNNNGLDDQSVPLSELGVSDMDSQDEEAESNDVTILKGRGVLTKSEELLLFKRLRKTQSFIECDTALNEQLSMNLLARDKYKDKSKFFYIKDNQLVHDSDYEQPNFIKLEPPSDADYDENYSAEAPSIHDLFDYTVDLKSQEPMETDEIPEEEYIIEELDEESLEMLQ